MKSHLRQLIKVNKLLFHQSMRKTSGKAPFPVEEALSSVDALEIPRLLFQYEKDRRGEELTKYYGPWASTVANSTEAWRPKHIANALYGLKSLKKHQIDAVLPLLSAINIQARRCSRPFSNIDLSQCFMGLKRLPCAETTHLSILAA